MKILAQSAVPTKPSYLHLGYLAAGTTYTQRPFMGVALGLMVLGIFLITRLRAVRTPRGLDIRPVLRRRPVWFTGVVILLAGAAILLLGPARERRLPDDYTRYVMRVEAPLEIEKAHRQGELASLTGVDITGQVEHLEDGWYRKMRVKRLVHPAAGYEVRSAGPDGRFDTTDDIVQSVAAPETRPASSSP